MKYYEKNYWKYGILKIGGGGGDMICLVWF